MSQNTNKKLGGAYEAPYIDVVEIVVEQPVFQLSYGGDNKPGNGLGDDLDGGIF